MIKLLHVTYVSEEKVNIPTKGKLLRTYLSEQLFVLGFSSTKLSHNILGTFGNSRLDAQVVSQLFNA